jgi:hypothetical protein
VKVILTANCFTCATSRGKLMPKLKSTALRNEDTRYRLHTRRSQTKA